MKNLISICLILMCVSGCFRPTSVDSYSSASIKENHKTVIGKIHVTYRGVEVGNQCRVYFSNGYFNGFQLQKDGYFIAALPIGNNDIQRLKCTVGRNILYKFGDFTFVVDKAADITNFGVVQLKLGNKKLRSTALINPKEKVASMLTLGIGGDKNEDARDIKLNIRPFTVGELKMLKKFVEKKNPSLSNAKIKDSAFIKGKVSIQFWAKGYVPPPTEK